MFWLSSWNEDQTEDLLARPFKFWHEFSKNYPRNVFYFLSMECPKVPMAKKIRQIATEKSSSLPKIKQKMDEVHKFLTFAWEISWKFPSLLPFPNIV